MMSILTMLLQVYGKMLYLPILVPKYDGKIWHQYRCWGSGGTILTKVMGVAPGEEVAHVDL